MCSCGLLASLALCCDEPSPDGAERLRDPVEATEIEVTEFEDHGVAMELGLQTQACFDGMNLDMSSAATASHDPVQVGGRGSAQVWAGTFTEGKWSPELGINGYGSSDGSSPIATAPHRWRITAERLVSERPDEYRFAVDWEHQRTASSDDAGVIEHGRRIVALREGQHHVLDTLELPPSAEGCDRTVLVDVSVVRDEPVAVRDRRLTYEVWHVHTLPDGAELASRSEVHARHAEQMAFELTEVRPPLAQPLVFGTTEQQVAMRPSGSLRGRIREDGAIDLLVEAQVEVTTVELGAPAAGGVAHRGRHAFRVEPGQTLRLELPEASGRWTRGDGEHVAYGHEVLRDHADALLVRVTLDKPTIE